MVLALLFWFAAAENELEQAIRAFTRAYAMVEANAADPVNPGPVIYEGALAGMLRKLDPHSVFFNPDQFQQLKELERSTSKGFGTVVSVLPGRVIVLQTMPGTPSARAGIAPGDEILAVNGIRLDWLDMEQLIGLLGETRRREARLDVRRQGSMHLLQFTMKPEEMLSASVDRAFMLNETTGYVRITSFEGETGKQLKEAIEKLGGASLKGLVLDLRNNPGGILPSALECSALFFPEGTKLLSIRGRARQEEETLVPKGVEPYKSPLAVLINEKSASAAEILAGAVQDHGRGVVVGVTSFGKGLVQSIYPLSEGSGMALTTAFYFTPKGRSIQRRLSEGQLRGPQENSGAGGIQPDHVVGFDRQTRLRAALDATGAFTSFATETIRKGLRVAEEFTLENATLDDFKIYLSERGISPGVSEWSVDREWIRSRLQQEVFNQTLGVEKGDEVEARRDPQVLRAAELIAR
ncbi:MAG: S41 family peptidase [Acidimicrobiia bacterium]|nr:S41 family peptidase [Acidimicrobiia bacterium]